MIQTKKQEFVMAIIDGFKKMKEFGYCKETPIYTIGVAGSIKSPKGKIFRTKYVSISRIQEGLECAIKIYCYATKEHFTLPANTAKQVDEVVTWMLDNNIMPSIKSMRTLVIPKQSIKF
ncbi:MAG: hypothetical protein WCL18_02640 [bacterium]